MRMALPPPTLRFGLTSQNMAAIVQYETRWPWVAHWVKWGCLCHADPLPATIFRWRCFKCYRIFNCQDVWCWNRPWFQCFDASLFLMMNEKKPTWTCPVCDSPAKYDDLMVDGYFQVWIGASVTNGCRKFQLGANVVFDDGGNAGAAGGDQGRGVAWWGEWDHLEPGLCPLTSYHTHCYVHHPFWFHLSSRQDGSWNPVPKDEEAERLRKEKEAEEKKNEVAQLLSVLG